MLNLQSCFWEEIKDGGGRLKLGQSGGEAEGASGETMTEGCGFRLHDEKLNARTLRATELVYYGLYISV